MPGSLSLFSLEGKNALITGAGRGLGQAMARGISEAGAAVALVSRSDSDLAATAATISGRSAVLPADLAELEQIPNLVDRAESALDGPIDIVVHAAGAQYREPAESFPHAEWDHILNVNLSAPFLLSQEIGRRQLEAARPGSHVFVGSLTSLLSVRSVIAYTASKSAIYGVVRNLSLEWSSRGIRVNAIGPGYIRTALTQDLVDDPVRGPKLLDRIPMGRLGQPEDMIGTAVFLASDASAYVTGQLLMVDGGWSAS